MKTVETTLIKKKKIRVEKIIFTYIRHCLKNEQLLFFFYWFLT